MEVIESQHTMPQATASHTTLGHPSLNWLYVSAMPTGSVDFSRVWWRRDCHQSSFTSRTHKRFNWSWATHTYKGGLVVHWYVFYFFLQEQDGNSMKVHEGVDFDESAPGDPDTFIWMEYRRGRESQFSNTILERYGTLDILLMGEIQRTTRDV